MSKYKPTPRLLLTTKNFSKIKRAKLLSKQLLR